MKVFSNYAQYYDLLNQTKDYKEEVKYVLSLLNKYAHQSKSILDLGCGTGLHDINLAESGYRVHGIDQSEEMIAIANNHLMGKPYLINHVNFSIGDSRSFLIDESFDAVISLFHVMSYQSTNSDLQDTVSTVSRHLKKNGVFIFDCWYGPAVLSDKPYERTKTFEDSEISVERTATPIMHPSKNLVDVNFEIQIKDKNTGSQNSFSELHKMRYLFEPELDMLLRNNGFELLKSEEWLTSNEPSFKTWYVTFIAIKK